MANKLTNHCQLECIISVYSACCHVPLFMSLHCNMQILEARASHRTTSIQKGKMFAESFSNGLTVTPKLLKPFLHLVFFLTCNGNQLIVINRHIFSSAWLCQQSSWNRNLSVIRPSIRLWHRLSPNFMHGFLSNFSCGFPWAICPDVLFHFWKKKLKFFTNIFHLH